VGIVTYRPRNILIIDPQFKKMAVVIVAPPSPAAVATGVSPVPTRTSFVILSGAGRLTK